LETELKKEEPPKKMTKFQAGQKGRSFLMCMTPQNKKSGADNGPRTLLRSAPRCKHPFAIACKLPFIAFPIGDGRTSEDVATLSGLFDTGGCCNMGNLAYHQTIVEQFPQFEDKMTCLEEKRFETINIGGLKDGVTITHMVRCAMPFIDKGEQCYVTLGLTEDLPIDTLFGIGFQQMRKMKTCFAAKRVESAFLQQHFDMTFKEPRRTNPDDV
jgi:hypothetical protein